MCSSNSEEADEDKAEKLAFSTLGSFSDTLAFLGWEGRGRVCKWLSGLLVNSLQLHGELWSGGYVFFP